METERIYDNDGVDYYYVVHLPNNSDYETALFGGPWMVSEHYLTVQRWFLAFDPEIDYIQKATVWVRLPKLPIHFFNKEFLARIGNKLGKIVLVDKTTLDVSRGRFARISVEVDLIKSLIAKFMFKRRVRCVEYEGLHVIYFNCGLYGHRMVACPLATTSNPKDEQVNPNGLVDTPMDPPLEEI